MLEKLPLLDAEYIKTGKLRFVTHPFFLRAETMPPAEAAWCASDQGKFSEYERALYEKQGTAWGEGNLVQLARDLGLNGETLAQCLANGTHREELQNAQRAAANQGVNSTPTFFINNRRVEGNQPYEVFKGIIDQELAAAK